jgi:hypothetical protein
MADSLKYGSWANNMSDTERQNLFANMRETGYKYFFV